jgi:hypothetical protein
MPSQYQTMAREALLEFTPSQTIGAVASESTDDDGVITVRFASVLGGYPGWQWNVSLSHVDGYDPTVIEAELLPDAGALLSPDWVPWSERLADYKAAQEAAGVSVEASEDDALGEAVDQDDDDDLDDDEDDDEDDLDDDDEDDDMDDVTLGGSNLHSGDLDGVDIDELADGPEDEDDEIADEVAEYGAKDTEDDEGL